MQPRSAAQCALSLLLVLSGVGCEGMVIEGPNSSVGSDVASDTGSDTDSKPDGVLAFVDGGTLGDEGSSTEVTPDGGTERGADPGSDADAGARSEPSSEPAFVDAGSEPVGDEPPPADGPPPAEDPASGCGGLDFHGVCEGTVARWCDAGRVAQVDCALRGQSCGYVNDSIGFFCTSTPADPPTDPVDPVDPVDPGGCGNSVEQAQLALTNQARQDAGVPPLVCDPALTLAARLHSQDMCDQRYFSHDSLDGRNFADRIAEQGALRSPAGENIALGQPTPESVHSSWMSSAGHRANILNGAYGRIGIGYVACGGRPYWTQDFTR